MKVTVQGRKIFFDQEAWALVKTCASREHRSPYNIVIAALKRGIKNAESQKAVESSQIPSRCR